MERPGALALLATLIALTAYSNHFTNGFQYDDFTNIVNNAYVHDLHHLPDFFRDTAALGGDSRYLPYRPLNEASFAFDYWWGGGFNPVAFHLTQFILHLLAAACAGLVFDSLLRRAGAMQCAAPLAVAGSLLFAVHPATTNCVNYITQRCEIISALGALGGLALYLRLPALRRFGLWLLPMAAGALAKPTALVMPLLMGIILWLLPERDAQPGRIVTGWRAPVAMGLAVAAAMFYLLMRMAGPGLSYHTTTPRIYFQTQLYAWLHYLRLFVFPAGLTVEYDWLPIPSWHDSRVLAGAAGNALLIAAAAWYARRDPRHGRLLLCGLLWFYAALLPAASIIPLPEMVNEQRLYLPLAGLVLCALSLARLLHEAGRRTLLSAATLCVIAACTWVTYRCNPVWRDETSLWENAVRVSPRSGRAWSNLANVYLRTGQNDRALASLKRARIAGAQWYPLELTEALLDVRMGDEAGAFSRFQAALRLAPDAAGPHFAYAEWLANHQQLEASADEMRKGLALSPADLIARKFLLGLYERLHQAPEYCSLVQETLAISPDAALIQAREAHCGVVPFSPTRPAGKETLPSS